MAGETIVLDPDRARLRPHAAGHHQLRRRDRHRHRLGRRRDAGRTRRPSDRWMVRTHYWLPNRLIKILLMLGTLGAIVVLRDPRGSRGEGRDDPAPDRRGSFAPGRRHSLYSDIQTATLHPAFVACWRTATLTSTRSSRSSASRRWYGDELTLDSASVTGYHASEVEVERRDRCGRRESSGAVPDHRHRHLGGIARTRSSGASAPATTTAPPPPRSLRGRGADADRRILIGAVRLRVRDVISSTPAARARPRTRGRR